jgi:hypothetical protein
MNFYKNVIATARITDLINLGWPFDDLPPSHSIFYDVTICVDECGVACYYLSDKIRDIFDDCKMKRFDGLVPNEKVIEDLHRLHRSKRLFFITKY